MPRRRRPLDLDTALRVTSVRVHPKVKEYVRKLCARANLNFNQFLILAVSVLEKEPVFKNLIKAHDVRRAVIAKYAETIEKWRDNSHVGPKRSKR